MNEPAARASLSYDLFGQGIAVHVEDAELRRRIAATLAPFRAAAEIEPGAHFHLARSAGEARVANGRQLNTGRMLVIADRRKLIAASLGVPPWRIYVEAFGLGDEEAYYCLFEPMLHLVLKRRGLLPWHGAVVARGDRGVLVVGESGSGKSTTALALLLAGWRFVADDELVLQASATGVCARGIEEHLHFTDTTASLLEGLPPAADLPLVRRGQGLKRRLEARVFGASAGAAAVAAVVFPRVDPAEETHLRKLPATECAGRLLLHPPKEFPAVIVDAPSIAAQFDLCTALAASVPSFDLVLGRSLERLPQLVAAVVA